MLSAYDTELADEQKYFDETWNQRERHRAGLGAAGEAAAGSQAATRAVRRDRDRMLETIAGPDEPVAFGRIDLEEDDETFYLGKHAIFDESRDLLVVAWQMKAVEGFYKATAASPAGLVRKRAFTTERNNVSSFEDTLYADLADRIESLTDSERRGVDDVLLRDLEQDRTGEMRDIVQTIHESQYDLIRQPLELMLVVQGGPGTGKTAVALHRASWLLFHHREDLRPQDVIVIGPSRTFGRYIERVLPGLGNDGVRQQDLMSLGPLTSHGRAEELDTARLKGDSRMAGLLARALFLRVRFPERTDSLDVGNGPRRAKIERHVVEEAMAAARRNHSTYINGRRAMRDWLTTTGNAQLSGAFSLETTAVDAALERIWPQLTPAAFLQDLLGSRQRITSAAGDDFTAGDIERLYRPSSEKLANETWSSTDVALLDEADALINGSGARDAYEHVIVDEAQDLTPMQLRSVRRRSRRGSCTIVGDIAQSTGPWARTSWSDVVEALTQDHGASLATLAYGYRVPRQIMELADRLLPHIAPDLVPPIIVRSGPSEPTIRTVDPEDVLGTSIAAAREFAADGNFVGLVCPDLLIDQVKDSLRDRGVTFTDAATGQLGASINVMTATQSKGLEFDAVVVVEPAEIAAGEAAAPRGLYIALTRSTKHLAIVHSRQFDLLGLGGGTPDDTDLTGLEDLVHPTVDPGPTRVTTDGSLFDVPPPRASAQPITPAPGASLRERMLRSTAGMIADDVRGAVEPDAYEDLVRLVASELGVSLSVNKEQLF